MHGNKNKAIMIVKVITKFYPTRWYSGRLILCLKKHTVDSLEEPLNYFFTPSRK